jgi:hypothetical protein
MDRIESLLTPMFSIGRLATVDPRFHGMEEVVGSSPIRSIQSNE